MKGEKHQEKEEKEERYYRMERSYGSFTRTIRLPVAVDGTKVTAALKNGVVTVTPPQTPAANGTTIPLHAEERIRSLRRLDGVAPARGDRGEGPAGRLLRDGSRLEALMTVERARVEMDRTGEFRALLHEAQNRLLRTVATTDEELASLTAEEP